MLEFLIFAHDSVAVTVFVLAISVALRGVAVITSGHEKAAIVLFVVVFLFVALAVPLTNDDYWCHSARTHNLEVEKCQQLTGNRR